MKAKTTTLAVEDESRKSLPVNKDRNGTDLGIFSFQPYNNRKMVLKICLLRDKEYFDIRWWYRFEGKTEFVPTRKGLMIESDLFKQSIFPEMCKLLKIDLSMQNSKEDIKLVEE